MRWRGVEINNVKELCSAINKITTKSEAMEFMELYRQESAHADENVGYLAGYYGPEEMRRLLDLFEVRHPVFGGIVPTPGAAYKAGRRAAKKYIQQKGETK